MNLHFEESWFLSRVAIANSGLVHLSIQSPSLSPVTHGSSSSSSYHLHYHHLHLLLLVQFFILNLRLGFSANYFHHRSIVCRRRLSLFGHVARMPDNVPAKDGVPPFPNWRRSRGHPPITWLHQICSDCGLSAGDTLNCAQYRAVWRTYATAS